MNQLPTAVRRQILHMLVEGSSMRSVSRVLGVSYPTVDRLMVRAGEVCGEIHDKTVRNIEAKRIECDELWAFVHTKNKRLKWALHPSDEHGTIWTYTAIDADTKLILAWRTGPRTRATTQDLMDDIESRLSSRVQIATDGMGSYEDAIINAFGFQGADYGQLMKIYGPTDDNPDRAMGRYATSIKLDRLGSPVMDSVTTAHNERHNLTMRMSMKRYTRRSNAISKTIRHHNLMLAVYFVWYNFCRPHMTLSIVEPTTPAMAAGLTEEAKPIEWILDMIDEKYKPRRPAKIGAYCRKAGCEVH